MAVLCRTSRSWRWVHGKGLISYHLSIPLQKWLTGIYHLSPPHHFRVVAGVWGDDKIDTADFLTARIINASPTVLAVTWDDPDFTESDGHYDKCDSKI